MKELERGARIITNIDQFVPNAPFLYPRKHHKTLQFSGAFKGKRKGALGTNGLTYTES